MDMLLPIVGSASAGASMDTDELQCWFFEAFGRGTVSSRAFDAHRDALCQACSTMLLSSISCQVVLPALALFDDKVAAH